MCRSMDFQRFNVNENDRLNVKSFFIRLSNLHAKKKQCPESLTLVYLPRISETGLRVSGKNIRPDSSAFVTLHRVIAVKTEDGEVLYGSRERVLATEGVTFELYVGEEKILKGVFRKDEEEEWKLECKCVLTRKLVMAGDNVARMEVCVELDGHVAMIQRMEMVVKRKSNKTISFCSGLQDIPEARETETEVDVFGSDGCCCSCGDVDGGSNGEIDFEEEINMDAVRWAVDVGIWFMCLGVGFLVSRRKRMF